MLPVLLQLENRLDFHQSVYYGSMVGIPRLLSSVHVVDLSRQSWRKQVPRIFMMIQVVSGDWDTIIERDPDLIVLVDASWDWADEKIFHLCSNQKHRNLRAVQNRAFIVVPFSASTLGVRIGSLAFNLAEAMTALIQGDALPSLEFSTENGRVLGKSGVRVMEKLPMWNGTDLDEYVPALPRQSN